MNSIADSIQWPPSSHASPLADNEVHVWAAPLDVAANILQRLAATLSSDEQDRAAKFKFEKHRNRYIAARGILRELLGKYLHTEPAALRFVYSTNGKPSLEHEPPRHGIESAIANQPTTAKEFLPLPKGEGRGEGEVPPRVSEAHGNTLRAQTNQLHFNLAHTEDLALIAVTRIGAIGVDVEHVRPVKEMDHLVARFFSARESEVFQTVSAEQKPAAFFNLWTRKEALLKATGEGITRSLSLVEVGFLPGEQARLLAISGDASRAAQWTLRELSPAPGFTGALAVQARDMVPRCAKWTP